MEPVNFLQSGYPHSMGQKMTGRMRAATVNALSEQRKRQ